MTAREGSRDGTGWERGWTGHERAQRRRLARLTMAEKLRWLEESQQVVESLTRARHGGGGAPVRRRKAGFLAGP